MACATQRGQTRGVQFGLFPAKVQVGDTVHEQVRVYATDDLTELWAWPSGKPVVVATGPGLLKQGRAMGALMGDGTRAKWTLQLADGTEWLASPGGGCGCSHPGKRFDPSKVERV